MPDFVSNGYLKDKNGKMMEIVDKAAREGIDQLNENAITHTDETLILENGELRVNVADKVDYDIDLPVKSRTVSDRFVALRGGGRNLFIGTEDFSGDRWNYALPEWSDAGETYEGLTVKMKSTAWGGVSQAVQLKAGLDYTLSAWIKRTEGAEIVFFGENTNRNDTSVTYMTSTDWQHVHMTFSIHEDGECTPRFENTVAGETMYICGLMLERSNIPSDWVPAPEEVARKKDVDRLSEEIADIKEGGAPYQQLVTGADGVAKWEEKPFYTKAPELKLTMQEETITSAEQYDWANNAWAAYTMGSFPRSESDETFVVIFDGEEYSCQMIEDEYLDAYCFGNGVIAGREWGNGEPFCALYSFSDLTILTPESGTHTIAVKSIVTEVVPIPVKYLSNTTLAYKLKSPCTLEDVEKAIDMSYSGTTIIWDDEVVPFITSATGSDGAIWIKVRLSRDTSLQYYLKPDANGNYDIHSNVQRTADRALWLSSQTKLFQIQVSDSGSLTAVEFK